MTSAGQQGLGELVAGEGRARGAGPRPPERFHAFVSYTTREDEIRVIKPLVEGECEKSLEATAAAIAEILRRRRAEYAGSEST